MEGVGGLRFIEFLLFPVLVKLIALLKLPHHNPPKGIGKHENTSTW